MYDPTLRVGRSGFEVQFTLLWDPANLVFDQAAKKLGTKPDPGLVLLEEPLPTGWLWTGDPVRSRNYLPDDEAVPTEWRGHFMDDHHDRLQHAVGYRTLWLYRDRVCFQLELQSEPLERGVSEKQVLDDVRALYERNLPELLNGGWVGSFTPKKQQRIKEQINIEIDDESAPVRRDAVEKLSFLAAGMYLLTRLYPDLDLGDESVHGLVEHLDSDITDNVRDLKTFDLFSNYRMLLDGFLFGTGWPELLSPNRLANIVGSRAHNVILASCWDNNRCFFYIHGTAKLTSAEMKRVSPRDFLLFRQLGIDSAFIDVMTGDVQPHLHPDRVENLEFIRDGLAVFTNLPRLRSFVRGALHGSPMPTGPVEIPMFHLRKTLSEGCVYMEFRNLHPLKFKKLPRYPAQFLMVDSPQGPLNVVYLSHLMPLTRDLGRLMDIAMHVGARLIEDIQRREDWVARRDAEEMDRRFSGMLQHYLDAYVWLP